MDRPRGPRSLLCSKFAKLITVMVWLYAFSLVVWFVLRLMLGDRVWWLALISIFAPYLFGPLVVFVPLGLAAPNRRYWSAILLPVLIFVWEYGALFDFWPPRGWRAGERAIEVMSFNIWGYSESAETAHVLLSEGEPDVVVLQELSPRMAQTLVEELGGLYPYRLLEPHDGPHGKGILSHYPLTDLGASVSSSLDSFTQVVRIETADGPFTLYHVHLAPTMVFYYMDVNSSVADGIADSFVARERQVSQLVADMARREGPVIAAGDFNMTDQSAAYALLTSHLTDAHRQVGRGFGHSFPAYAGSFQGIPILPRTVRVDMIFYSAGFVALDCRVGREYGESDHLPVSASLAWAE